MVCLSFDIGVCEELFNLQAFTAHGGFLHIGGSSTGYPHFSRDGNTLS
jgi:hypothetical protein